jgi:4-amino-4-deoxy-L-arabinose transferase-like glycosyltransferase
MARHRVALLLIVLTAIGLRITYTARVGDGFVQHPRVGQIAHNIVAYGRWFVRNAGAEAFLLAPHTGNLFNPASVDYARIDNNQWHPEVAEPIGASVVLAGLWAITGDERYVQLQIVQDVLDGLMALLVYRIAMQLFGRRRAALIAALLYAIYPRLAWEASDPYTDIWAVDFTVVLVAIYLQASRAQHRWRWLILCGVCAGIGAYFRPQVLLIAPLLALVEMPATGRREALGRMIVTGGIAALLLVPWTIRNYDDFHAFVPTRSSFWLTALNGLNELPNNYVQSDSEAALVARIHRIRPQLVPETPAWDALLKPIVIHTIEQHPFFYLEVLTHRVGLATVLPDETLGVDTGAIFGPGTGVAHKIFVVVDYAMQPAVFLLAILCLCLTWRRRRQANMMLVAVVLSVLLPYIAIHVEARYLLPAAFAYLIWIGQGLDLLLVRLAERLLRSNVRFAGGRVQAPSA